MSQHHRKPCQKYFFLFSLGFLLLLPLTSGCGWISGWFSGEPKQATPVHDPEAEVVDSTSQDEESEPSRRRLGTPAPKTTESTPPPEVKPSMPEKPVSPPPSEPAVEPIVPVKISPPVPEATPQPVPQPVEEISPRVPVVPDETDSSTVPVQTDDPIDQTSPVDTTVPIDTESPVNTDSPVQNSLSFLFFRWFPVAMLMLQEDQNERVEEEEIVQDEEDTLPDDAAEEAAEESVPESPGIAEDVESDSELDTESIAEEHQPGSVAQEDSPAAQPAPPIPVRPTAQFAPPTETPAPPSNQSGERRPPAQFAPSTETPVQPSNPSGENQPPQRSGRYDRPGRMERSDRPDRRESSEFSVVRQPRTEPAVSIRFNFRYAPWKDVIEWFADQTALSVQADKMPTGTLNLTDGQSYTPTEGLDILNSYLLFKDYALVRKGQSLFLIYLPDTIPANLLEPITAHELDARGKYEICKCVFNLNRTTPEIIQAEIEKMLGPQGSIVVLPKSQQIMVTETGGTLRSIRDIIQRIDDPDGLTAGAIHMIELKNLTAEEALQMMRTLLAIEVSDPSLRTAADASGKKILLSGRGDMIERAKEVIARIDDSFGSNDPALAGQPQYEVYDVGVADPNTVFSVLQTLLAGTPDVRLSLDPRTGGISLRGRPASHATVREAIRQMQLNVPQIDIIPLKRLSPASVVETIKKFIVTASPSLTPTVSQDGDRNRNRGNQTVTTTPSGIQPPTVEADNAARQIIVRGTISQITDIRALLAKLGEDGTAVPISNVSTVRAIPLSPTATSLVLEQLQAILPKLDPKIKVVVPTLQEDKEKEPKKDVDTLIDETFDTEPPMTFLFRRLAAHPILAQVTESAQPEVVISVTPAGIMLSSDDPEALNKLESVIRMLSDETVLGKMELKTYNLKYSTASVVSSTLQTLLGTGSPEGGVSGAGSVDLPEWELEVQGLLAAQGQVIEKTGTVTITPDERLNALYIQANLVDHKTIEKLLTMLDVPNRVDIMNKAKPRLVGPLMNIRAEEAKTMVETVFANRMQGNTGNNANNNRVAAANFGGNNAGGNNNRGNNNSNQRNRQGNNQQQGQPQMPGMMGGGPPGMEMMRQVMMAQMGRGGNNTLREQEPPMVLGVDARSNSLIVSSSEALYLEVKTFVEDLDASAQQTSNIVVTESLVDISPDLLNRTLSNMFGNSVEISSIPSSMTSQNMSIGGNFGSSFGGGGGGFRMSGTSSFGGNSPFGNNNPFMNMMRSPFGGGNTFRPGGAAMFGGGNTFRPGGAATFGGGQNTFGGNRGGAATFGGGNRTGTNRRR